MPLAGIIAVMALNRCHRSGANRSARSQVPASPYSAAQAVSSSVSKTDNRAGFGATAGTARRRGALQAPNGQQALMVTAGGSMIHRATCSVIEGRDDARPVTTTTGLTPCRLCNPLSSAQV